MATYAPSSKRQDRMHNYKQHAFPQKSLLWWELNWAKTKIRGPGNKLEWCYLVPSVISAAVVLIKFEASEINETAHFNN